MILRSHARKRKKPAPWSSPQPPCQPALSQSAHKRRKAHTTNKKRRKTTPTTTAPPAVSVALPEYRPHTLGEKGYVVMLDGSRFETLPTRKKTLQALSEINARMIRTCFAKLSRKLGLARANEDRITWVGKHWQAVEAWIDDKSEHDWARSTRAIYITALAHCLLAIDKHKYRELTRRWWNEAFEISEQNQLAAGQSHMGDRELSQFVSYAELVEKRDELYALWQADRSNKRLNMYHLILAFNTYVPPLRLTAITMQLWRKQDVPPPHNKTTNYLWEYEKGKWAMVIQHDKVETRRMAAQLRKGHVPARDEFKLAQDLCPMLAGQGATLDRIVNESLAAWPRKDALFAGVRSGWRMVPSGYRSALHKMFDPKLPHQNLIRKAFVAWFYEQNPSWNDKETIARHMRHSVLTAQQTYLKINLADGMRSDASSSSTSSGASPPLPKLLAAQPRDEALDDVATEEKKE